nr:immunoglobulin light chain junction region [Macaca mulatta]
DYYCHVWDLSSAPDVF